MHRKVYMSIIAMFVILATLISTTFAWVGVFTYASTDKMDLGLKVVDTNQNYSILISADDVEYKESISSRELELSIIKNRGVDLSKYDQDLLLDDVFVETLFFNTYFSHNGLSFIPYRLRPSTPYLDSNGNITSFYRYSELNSPVPNVVTDTNDYFKYDLYFKIEPKEGLSVTSTNVNENIYLSNVENFVEGNICTGPQSNGNPFDLPDFYNNPEERDYFVYDKIVNTYHDYKISNDDYDVLRSIPFSFSINSKNAVRFAFEIHNPAAVGQEYPEDSARTTKIYQPGSQTPKYDAATNVYDMGGILPIEYSYALTELDDLYHAHLNINRVSKSKEEKDVKVDIDESRLHDLEMDVENRGLFERATKLYDDNGNPLFFGIQNGVQTRVKISVYFWFEGWDADCMRFLDYAITSYNLEFTTNDLVE